MSALRGAEIIIHFGTEKSWTYSQDIIMILYTRWLAEQKLKHVVHKRENNNTDIFYINAKLYVEEPISTKNNGKL